MDNAKNCSKCSSWDTNFIKVIIGGADRTAFLCQFETILLRICLQRCLSVLVNATHVQKIVLHEKTCLFEEAELLHYGLKLIFHSLKCYGCSWVHLWTWLLWNKILSCLACDVKTGHWAAGAQIHSCLTCLKTGHWSEVDCCDVMLQLGLLVPVWPVQPFLKYSPLCACWWLHSAVSSAKAECEMNFSSKRQRISCKKNMQKNSITLFYGLLGAIPLLLCNKGWRRGLGPVACSMSHYRKATSIFAKDTFQWVSAHVLVHFSGLAFYEAEWSFHWTFLVKMNQILRALHVGELCIYPDFFPFLWSWIAWTEQGALPWWRSWYFTWWRQKMACDIHSCFCLFLFL